MVEHVAAQLRRLLKGSEAGTARRWHASTEQARNAGAHARRQAFLRALRATPGDGKVLLGRAQTSEGAFQWCGMPLSDWCAMHLGISGATGTGKSFMIAAQLYQLITLGVPVILLSLRLRELVTDEVFEARRRGLQATRQDLEAKLAATGRRSGEETARALEGVFHFGAEARRTFLSGTSVQRRMILEAVASNYTLRGRKVALQLEQPFGILAEANGYSNWCARQDSNLRPQAPQACTLSN